MAEELELMSFPSWHVWPAEGSVRRLGAEIRREHPHWEDGVEYTKGQVSGFVWTVSARERLRWDALPDDATFVCELGNAAALFTLVQVDSDPLVDAGPAQAAVHELRSSGWSLRRIGQSAEVSYDAVGRLAAGTARRRVRSSTEQALLQLAAKANGKAEGAI
jgi:hypothetical protein